VNAKRGEAFSCRRRAMASMARLASIGVGLAWAAGCGQGGGNGDAPAGGSSGLEVDLDPSQIPRDDTPSASGGTGGEPLEEPDPEPGPAGLPARGVSDFDREAQQAAPRADDARDLGGACQSTADCRMGLGCADVVFSGVGQPYMAGGYCSRWCEQDADCATLAAGAYCAVGFFGSDLNLCLSPCVTGDEGGAEKCGGREDLSCSIGRPPGIQDSCLPRCRSNADCPTGRCSSSTGLCETASIGATSPPGATCSTERTSCNGFCAPLSAGSSDGVCSGYCRLGSTCGAGPGSVCASEFFGLREGDGGTCEQACNTSMDCAAGYTACAPTGLLEAAGQPAKGCALVYSEPASLAPQRLSIEQLALASLPSSVMNVSTTSIFQGLSHRLSVEDGAVCVAGNLVGVGALLELHLQLRPNNGSALATPGLTGVSFDAEGPHVVRFDLYTTGRSFRYLSGANTAGDIGEGPQRIGTDQLFDIWAGDAPFDALEAPELEALAFSLSVEEGAGSFRFCLSNLALEFGE
jgi:hypothetical protein